MKPALQSRQRGAKPIAQGHHANTAHKALGNIGAFGDFAISQRDNGKRVSAFIIVLLK
jgi:hypothetical protein